MSQKFENFSKSAKLDAICISFFTTPVMGCGKKVISQL